MDDRARILKLLAEGSEDARELARKLGLSRNPLFSLLMKMEKEDLIVWNGHEWSVGPPSPDTSHPSQGGSSA